MLQFLYAGKENALEEDSYEYHRHASTEAVWYKGKTLCNERKVNWNPATYHIVAI